MWRVLKDYQVKYQFDLAEDSKKEDITAAQRLEELSLIFSMLKENLTKILISKEQEPILDEGIKNALNFYKERFANS